MFYALLVCLAPSHSFKIVSTVALTDINRTNLTNELLKLIFSVQAPLAESLSVPITCVVND